MDADGSSSPSSCGEEEMEARLRTLERGIEKRQQKATESELNYGKKLRRYREMNKFLTEELIAARAEVEAGNKKGPEVVEVADRQDLGITPPGKAPLEVFPIQVWGSILDNLEAPHDLASCSNASPVFRKKLKPIRTEFLFQQVLPVLIQSGSFSLFQQLLDLRRICPAWKTGVDSFLENHPCHYHLNDYCTRSKNIYTQPFALFDCFQLNHRYSFSSWCEIIQCKTVIKWLSSSSSFFLGRCILLDDSLNTGIHSKWFWKGVHVLLGKVGVNIWHCEIRQMRLQVGDRLPNILELMPNLKTLKISFQMDGGIKMETDSEEEADSEEVTLPPPSNQMPPLPHLQVLKVRGWQPHQETVHKLLSSYTHVKKLEFDSIDHLYGRSLYPNLEALAAPSVNNRVEMEQLQRFVMNSTPSLLHMSFFFPDYTKIRGLKELVNALRMKPVPLKSLKFEFQNTNEQLNCVRSKLPLPFPNLKELVIDTGEKLELGFGRIDFLLPLKSLEKLTLIGATYRGPSGEESEDGTGQDSLANNDSSLINFQGMETRLYESNIWQLFPKLDQILLKIFEQPGVWKSLYYKRAGYQKYASAIMQQQLIVE